MSSRKEKKKQFAQESFDYLRILADLRRMLAVDDPDLEKCAKFVASSTGLSCFAIYRLGEVAESVCVVKVESGELTDGDHGLDLTSLQVDSLRDGRPLSINEEQGSELLCFPILARGRQLVGVVCMGLSEHAALTRKEAMLVGELVAVNFALSFQDDTEKPSPPLISWLFERCRFPVLLIDRSRQRLLRVNAAVEDIFMPESSDSPARSVISVVESVADQVDQSNPVYFTRLNQFGLRFEAFATCLLDTPEAVLVVLVPSSTNRLADSLELHLSQDDQSEHTARHLVFERMVRKIMSGLFSSLEPTVVLQSLVDNLGQSLAVSRCLAVRSDTSILPVVSHEYAEPNVSPLGLGRTARFPASIIARFRSGPLAVADVTELRKHRSIPVEDVSALLDNDISSIAGAPILGHGASYGAVIAVQLGEMRSWSANELELIRLSAGHAAVALEHANAYQLIKDQLLQANLLGNLARQLNTSLQLVSQSVEKSADKQKKTPSPDTPPLSPRELEVLKLIATGLSNKEIASRLFLTASTVELHASRIRKKLSLRSRTALVKYACDHGIV